MSETQPAPSSKRLLIAGWIVTALPVLGLVFSGILKLLKPADVIKEFERLGWSGDVALGLGIVELTCTVVYAIPRTSVLGAILLTAYLGGAVATHVRIDDPFVPPIMMGVLVWLGLYLRDGRLRELLPLRR